MFTRQHKNGNDFSFKILNKDKKYLNKYVDQLTKNCKITKSKYGQHYLHICLNGNLQKDKKEIKSKYNSVFLDPGVRTFQTFYSPELIQGKLGNNFENKIDKINKKMNEIKSLIDKKPSKRTRYNMKKKCFKLRTKLKNIISDLHFKSASWLCKNFKYIFIPIFETSKMANKNKRKIGKKTTQTINSRIYC